LVNASPTPDVFLPYARDGLAGSLQTSGDGLAGSLEKATRATALSISSPDPFQSIPLVIVGLSGERMKNPALCRRK
jgi:hypothetical protein